MQELLINFWGLTWWAKNCEKEQTSTQNLIIFWNFQNWSKFLISYKKYVHQIFNHTLERKNMNGFWIPTECVTRFCLNFARLPDSLHFNMSQFPSPDFFKKLWKWRGFRTENLPCIRRVFFPVGALNANWSKVKHSPPAFKILALAPSVNLRAQTVNFGITRTRLSSVTVDTVTTILPSFPGFFTLRT